jgi:2-(1,2-epoxy-1,2-dihydrophenyl)acetyl-CoA isomerase
METIDYGTSHLAVEGSLATLTLNDPGRLNAIDESMANGLLAGLAEVSKPRRRIRCLLLTGAGRAFCAGANLLATAKQLDQKDPGQPRVLDAVQTLFHPLLRKFHALPIPVVAAIGGPCVGIGIGLALTADYIIASQAAYFLVPFRKLASAPDSALTWLLPRVVGLQRARQMILRGERLSAEAARDWGLVNEIASAEQFEPRARAVAEEFADGPTLALGEMRGLIRDGLRLEIDSAMEAEVRAVARTSRTKDNVAAMKLFGTKEPPKFTGE